MGRSGKIFLFIMLCLCLLSLPLLSCRRAEAASLDDPLVSRSWIQQRIDALFSPLEQRLAQLEESIRAYCGRQSVDIELHIGQTTALVNGVSQTLDTAPMIADIGYTLVPIRFVAESLGIQVEWIPEGKHIRFYDGDTEVRLTVGSTEAFINGKAYRISYPPIIDARYSEGRTLVHVRFVGEAFGCSLDWYPRNGGTQIVYIKR